MKNLQDIKDPLRTLEGPRAGEDRLDGRLVGWLAGWRTGQLAGGLAGWLDGWLDGWLNGRSTGPPAQNPGKTKKLVNLDKFTFSLLFTALSHLWHLKTIRNTWF